MKKNYSDKLKDPRWQKKRLEVLSRDEFTCQKCKDTKATLHVHHKEYLKGHEPWDYELDNFITFCECCHMIEEIYKEFDDMTYIRTVKYTYNNGDCDIYSLIEDHKNKINVIDFSTFRDGAYEFKYYLREELLNTLVDFIGKYKQQY